MIYISHKGNLAGPNPLRENQPEYLKEALNLGFHVETDVWLLNNTFYLGHDRPEYIINFEFLLNEKVWAHCKNLAALDALILESDANCFFHDKDDFTLTSKCYIWTYPRNLRLTSNSIAVLPEKVKNWNLKGCHGICTDYVLSYQRWDEEGRI